MIYLDHNATTPIDPRVAQAIAECHATGYLNPSSAHSAGRAARQRIETARATVARILGADITHTNSDEVIFTSGGTESNNLALRGLAGPIRAENGKPTRIIVSAVEHPSIIGAAQHMAMLGYDVRRLPVDSLGIVRLDYLEETLTEETRIVSVMTANNETGVIQPLKEVVSLCQPRGVLVHTDAVQMVGKLPVDFKSLGVDALSFSGHKFHGPSGIGGLILRGGVRLEPILHGGFQQQALRPGTESVALAVGLEAALLLWKRESPSRALRMERLRDELESRLRAGEPGIVVNGAMVHGDHASQPTHKRIPHTSNISFPAVDRQALLLALDQQGICCSTGSACASGSSEPSPVLLAMGCSKAVIEGSLRISLGATTTQLEIEAAAAKILEIHAKLARQKGVF